MITMRRYSLKAIEMGSSRFLPMFPSLLLARYKLTLRVITSGSKKYIVKFMRTRSNSLLSVRIVIASHKLSLHSNITSHFMCVSAAAAASLTVNVLIPILSCLVRHLMALSSPHTSGCLRVSD